MKKIIVLIVIVALFAVWSISRRAVASPSVTETTGTCTMTELFDSRHAGAPDSAIIRAFKFTCTADASGDLAATLSNLYGYIIKVNTNPAGGALAPDDNWDITLPDADGLDAFAALGVDRHTSNSERFAPFIGDGTFAIPMPVNGTYTLTGAGFGASNQVEVTVTIQQN